MVDPPVLLLARKILASQRAERCQLGVSKFVRSGAPEHVKVIH